MSTSDISSSPSLYERLGGAPTVQEAVRRFYDRVLGDPQLAGYFEGADMNRLRGHQARVIGEVLGGPAEYDGDGLGAAHAHLDITDADYERVGAHLLAVLDELGAGEEAANTVTAALSQLRGVIVTAPPVSVADTPAGA